MINKSKHAMCPTDAGSATMVGTSRIGLAIGLVRQDESSPYGVLCKL